MTVALDAGDGRSRSSSISTADSAIALPTLDGIVPARPPTTVEGEQTRIPVEGLSQDVLLKVDAGPGCGGIAWPAGEVLSRYLAFRHAEHPEALRDRTVLELGSGTGLCGIVAGILEPTADVWVTDQDILLDLMEANVELNLPDKARRNVHVGELNWGETLPDKIPARDISVILAADCVYFEVARIPLLVQTLCDLAPIGKEIEILFCWKKRRKADKRFFQMLKKHFDSEVVADDRPGEQAKYNREGVTLSRLFRRR